VRQAKTAFRNGQWFLHVAPLAKVIHDAFKTMERELRRLVERQRTK
jgi:hypothetical protein